MKTFVRRLLGTALLQRQAYEDVERDPDATRQALGIVAATSVMAGIGGIPAAGALALFGVTLAGVAGWAVYAGLAYYIGTHLFATEDKGGSWSDVARTVGFASAPRGLLVLGLIPGAYEFLSVVLTLWVLATTVAALSVALELSLWRAVATSLVAIIAQAIVFALIGVTLAIIGL